MKKTVVHALSQKASNLPQTAGANYWGIGDLLRGSNVLFEICRELGADYVLDLSGHPVGELFVDGRRSDAISEAGVPFYAFKDFDEGKALVQSLLDADDCIVINTNGGLAWPERSAADWRALVVETFRPTAAFQSHLTSVVPSTPYQVMHFRLGDRSLIRKKSIAVDEAVGIFRAAKDHDMVVISDSEQLKARLRAIAPDTRISDGETAHTGLAASGAALTHTMADFFLVAGARSVDTYSTYSWPSGFVVAASRIYDVPMTCHSLAPEDPGLLRRVASVLRPLGVHSTIRKRGLLR